MLDKTIRNLGKYTHAEKREGITNIKLSKVDVHRVHAHGIF